jgi:beta-lactamase superfamily II metal-dependent hydrolase
MKINEGKVTDGKHVMVHFVDVGKGNCVIIQFPSGHTTFVDIDNSHIAKENTEPIGYFTSKQMDSTVFRFILTHPDMDHMSGLKELNQKYPITNFWDTENDKKIDEWENTPYKKEDWDTYQSFKGSETSPKHLEYLRGAIQDCCFVEDGIII